MKQPPAKHFHSRRRSTRSLDALVLLTLVATAAMPGFGAGASAATSASTASARTGDDPEARDHRKAVPGTSISLIPPTGFRPAASFDGFQHVAAGASIMVSVVPGPYAQIVVGLSMPEQLRQRGMTRLESIDLPVGDEPGKLVRVEQEANGSLGDKWIRVFGSSERTAMIVATVPRAGADEWMPRLRTAVLTARWDDAAESAGPFDGSAFRLGDLAGMEFVHRTSGMLSFTPDGEPDAELTGKPLFLAGPSIAPRTPSSPETFAEARIRDVQGHRVTEIESTTPVEIDGLSGLEIVAKAMDREAAAEAVIVQTILFDGAGYWRTIGIARKTDRDPVVETFRKMTRSFERVRIAHDAPDGGFRLTAPGGWIDSSSVANLELTHTGAGCQIVGIPQHNIDPETVSLDQMASLLTREFPAEGREGPTKKTIADRPALETVVRQPNDPNTKLLLVVRGEKGYYVIVGACPSWAFDDHRSTLDDVIATFEEIE